MKILCTNLMTSLHRGLKRLLLGLAFVLVASGVFAQVDKLVNISYDPQSDSVFFEQMQQRMAEIRKTRPTVALVLAGGGAKGTAHIGVLKFIEEKGIPVDFVAGTSMGALIGGLYSMGYSAVEIDSIVRAIDWNVMMTDNIPFDFYSYARKMYKSTYMIDIPYTRFEFKQSLPSGFMYGLNIYNMLSSLSVGYQHDMNFMDMPTPYTCVATEIVTQKEKHWTSGSLVDAMRSTMSIPGYFQPVRVDSMILTDGGTKNNFPTDIAVAAGADIIIGVEMTLPRDYQKVNNMADVLMQTAQYSGGLEAHNKNVENATVYITPDITGFGMFSFDAEGITTLIRRGYSEAQKHERELDSIVQIVGNGGRKLHHPKSINSAETKVKITGVEYEGLSIAEKRFVDDKVRLKLNEYYDKSDLELSQAIIFGTMAFSQASYRLIDDGADGYKLLFRCEKRPPNSIGVGLRLDTEEWFSALLNLGIGRNKIFGSIFDVTVRLSMSPYLRLNWSYLPKRGLRFGAEFKTLYRNMLGNEDHLYNMQYHEKLWRNELSLYFASTWWSQVDLKAGVRGEYMPFRQEIRPFSETIQEDDWNWKNFCPYAYLRFVYDNEDTHYFPSKGMRVNVAYDYNFRNTHYAAVGVHGVIPCGKIFAIVASANGRYIFGDDYENLYMFNQVGGIMPGRYYDHQIPFIGYNTVRLCKRFVTTADMEFRFKVGKKVYLSAIGATLHDFQDEFTENIPTFAAALQFGYNAKYGPIMANFHWRTNREFDNVFVNKFGFYLSAGYNF